MAFDKEKYLKMIAEGKGQEAAQLINKETAGTNKTTSGVVQAGKMAEFEKAIQEGKSGAELISAPATFQQATPSASATVQPTGTQSYADQLAETQRKAKLENLDKVRQQKLLSLSEEERRVQPQFAQQRSQARATSQRGAQSFAEFMAQRGLASSGGAALGETQRLGALQGALGGLQQQEQDVLANIGARRTGIEQAYQSDLAATQANLEAQRLQNAIAQQAQQREQFAQTAGQFAGDYKAQIDQVLGDNDPTNDWQADILGALRQQKIAELGLNQQGQPLQQGISMTPSQAMQLWGITGVATPDIARALGVEEGSRYSTYSGRTSGGTSSTAPYTQQQYADYVAMWNNYLGPQSAWRDDPQGLVNTLTRDVTIPQQLGNELYQELLNNAVQYAQGYKPPQPLSREEELKRLQTEQAINEITNPQQQGTIDVAGTVRGLRERFSDVNGALDANAVANELDAWYQQGLATSQELTNIAMQLGYSWFPPTAQPQNFMQGTSSFRGF